MARQLFSALAAIVIFTTGAQALETDNYLMWTMDLQDAADKVNEYINQQIAEEVEQSQQEKKPLSCHALTLRIGERFRTRPPVTHPLEDWLALHLDEGMLYPQDHDYRLQSIYRDPFRFYLKYVKLAPSVQVNGVYLGTDKLSHFVSTGRRYYERFHKLRQKNVATKEALENVIRFGLKNEKTFLGTWSSGVFSYGDMEANYQGLRFYLNLCSEGEESLVTRDTQGQWQKNRTFEIRQYVSPYWDESFNPSFRLKRNWRKTSRTIKAEYCHLYQSARVQERFALYRQWSHQSFSLDYIAELQKAGHRLAPSPLVKQSFEELCR